MIIKVLFLFFLHSIATHFGFCGILGVKSYKVEAPI
jgi:hypothetical protein